MSREIRFRIYIRSQKRMIDAIGFCYESVSQIRIWYRKGELIFNESFLIVDTDSMEFTGLHDKEGTSIYEGDIVVENGYPYFDDGKRNYVAVIEWCFAGFHFVKYCVNPEKIGISDGVNEPLEEGEEFNIIGNIFEHPHLIK